MDSICKTASSVAVLGIVVALQGCEGPDCAPTTPSDLVEVSQRDCPTILVENTGLETLDGLDLSDSPTFVRLVRNPALVDITNASGALSLNLFRNEALRVVEATTLNGIVTQQSPLDRVDLTLDPVAEHNGEPTTAVVSLSPSPTELRLACVAACLLPLALDDVDGMTISADATVTADLIVREEVDDWTPLQGLGVPASVRFEGVQDAAVLAEYHEWLIGEGFDGTFEPAP